MKFKLFRLLLLGCLALLPAVLQGSWKKLSASDLPTFSKNLARHHLGASVNLDDGTILLSSLVDDRNRSAEALLVEDPSIGYPLPVGEANVVVQLSEIEILHSLSFTNDGAAGRVAVSTAITKDAAEEGRWQASSFAVYDLDKRAVTVELSGVDARYVRISWDSSAPGRIYNFGIFGEPHADEFVLRKMDGEAPDLNGENPAVVAADFNLLSHYSGARLAYVSSGNGDVTALIDGDSSTSYTFGEADKFPAVIIDLGTSYSVTRASALFDTADAKLAFFVLPELSESEDWVGRTSFEENKLGDHEPVALGSDNAAVGRLALDFAEAEGRYVVFQFAPASGREGEGFSVVDLGVFSNSIDARYLVERSSWYESSGKAGGKGKAPIEELPAQEQLMSYSTPGPYSSPGYYGGSTAGYRGGGGYSGGGSFGSPSYAIPPPQPYPAAFPQAFPIAGYPLPPPPPHIHEEIIEEEIIEEEIIEVPRIVAVSRLAISNRTYPGIGHKYFQTMNKPLRADAAYHLEDPQAFGGVIQPVEIYPESFPLGAKDHAVWGDNQNAPPNEWRWPWWPVPGLEDLYDNWDTIIY